MYRLYNLILILVITSGNVLAQSTQTIKGRITDPILQQPVAGATVLLVGQNRSTLTDADGQFRFTSMPLGQHQIRITHAGFKPLLLEHLVLNAGKELSLSLTMEAAIEIQNEVVVKARSVRSKPINELSVVSARAFSVEETQRYAAAVNDPLRMATSFAGVVSPNDGGNHIIVRGNAPNALLWRMEGVDIPNPNHFSNPASSGGGISMLSAQVLANSDFVTGAFAAEYGNAVGGVFDLRLRKGNNDQSEFTAEAGLLGLNLAAEGPFSRKYKGSYLVNYRYSTLGLLSKIGINTVGDYSTNFSDLSYNINLPAGKAGDFTVFGINGWNDQRMPLEKDPSKWEEEWNRYGGKYNGHTVANGVTHSILLSDRNRLKTVVLYSEQTNGSTLQYVARPDSIVDAFRENIQNRKWTLTSTLNTKLSRSVSIRSGIIAHHHEFNLLQRSRENTEAEVEERINMSGQTQTLQGFSQANIKPSDKWTITGGVHLLYLQLNKTAAIEPRLGVQWQPDAKNTFGLGYGLHSQTQIMGVYFAKSNINGKWEEPNKSLGFTKSHHFVLSHNRILGHGLRLRTEAYYQHLFNLPVSIYDTSAASTVNIGENYLLDPLTNAGTGRNYGLEVSLEKQLRNNIYFLFSNSLYESKYRALDGVLRNTRYNGNYASSLTAGKDYVRIRDGRTFSANIKMLYAGGYRDTPLDEPATLELGYAKYIESAAFTLRNPAYFRTDIRVSMKWNRRATTSTLSLDIQNVTNRQNVFSKYYDNVKKEIRTAYQAGFIPVLAYRIEF